MCVVAPQPEVTTRPLSFSSYPLTPALSRQGRGSYDGSLLRAQRFIQERQGFGRNGKLSGDFDAGGDKHDGMKRNIPNI